MANNKIDQADSPKFQLIVETATNLFMRYGVKRVTVEEICKTAKVSKMTFYKYFKHKIDLAEYIIFSIFDEGQSKFDAIYNSNTTFAEKMNKFIEFKIYYAKMVSKEFLEDFIHLSDKVHNRIMESGKKNQIMFIQMIKDAQRNNEVRTDISIQFINYMLNTFLELRDDKQFVSMFNNVEEITTEMINFFFYGIMGEK